MGLGASVENMDQHAHQAVGPASGCFPRQATSSDAVVKRVHATSSGASTAPRASSLGATASPRAVLGGSVSSRATSADRSLSPLAQVSAAAKAAMSMPVVPLPKLPRLVPGKPLDPSQRKELVELQQQIQAQLAQQRVLVESIRQLPQFKKEHTETLDLKMDEVMHRMREQNCKGAKDLVGDLPAQDPEDLVASDAGSVLSRSNSMDDVASSSSLGKKPKVPATPRVEIGGDSVLTARQAEQSPAVFQFQAMSKTEELNRAIPQEPKADAQKTELASLDKKGVKASTDLWTDRAKGNETTVQSSDTVNRTAAAVTALKERPRPTVAPTLRGPMKPADRALIGTQCPGREQRPWIEAVVQRMFRSVGTAQLRNITDSFREWRLPACVTIVQQSAPVATGPGLCVLFTGVVDVLHCPRGSSDNEKVCTYDRCGQCFGELELMYDSPSGVRARKSHWATIATRTPTTVWTIEREKFREHLGASRPVTPRRNIDDRWESRAQSS